MFKLTNEPLFNTYHQLTMHSQMHRPSPKVSKLNTIQSLPRLLTLQLSRGARMKIAHTLSDSIKIRSKDIIQCQSVTFGRKYQPLRELLHERKAPQDLFGLVVIIRLHRPRDQIINVFISTHHPLLIHHHHYKSRAH